MLRITVSGDPEGGYLVDIHDGKRNEVYSPAAENDHSAMAAAIKEHDPELAAALSHAIGQDEAAAKTMTDLTDENASLRTKLGEAEAQVTTLTAELAAAREPAPPPVANEV